jgi:hypothetical protein
MAGTTQQRLFVLVPDGSTLEWTLSSESEDFIASADAARNGEQFKSWKHEDLANQTVELKPLESPDRYILLLQIAFTGTAQTEVSLLVRVVRPDGTVHSSPWNPTFQGKKPEVHQAIVSVLTKK